MFEIQDYPTLQFEEKGRWFIKMGDEYLCNFMTGALMQWTGLRDKNNNKVWEGDILNTFEDEGNYEEKLKIVEYVKWNEEEGKWGIWNAIIDNVMGYDEDWSEDKCFFGSDIKELTVLGNLYENPELLK